MELTEMYYGAYTNDSVSAFKQTIGNRTIGDIDLYYHMPTAYLYTNIAIVMFIMVVLSVR